MRVAGLSLLLTGCLFSPQREAPPVCTAIEDCTKGEACVNHFCTALEVGTGGPSDGRVSPPPRPNREVAVPPRGEVGVQPSDDAARQVPPEDGGGLDLAVPFDAEPIDAGIGPPPAVEGCPRADLWCVPPTDDTYVEEEVSGSRGELPFMLLSSQAREKLPYLRFDLRDVPRRRVLEAELLVTVVELEVSAAATVVVYDVETDFDEASLEWVGRPITGGARRRIEHQAMAERLESLALPITAIASEALDRPEPLLGLALRIEQPANVTWALASKEGPQLFAPPLLVLRLE